MSDIIQEVIESLNMKSLVLPQIFSFLALQSMHVFCKLCCFLRDFSTLFCLQVTGLIWSQDLRVQEVRRLLQSSRPVRVSVVQLPEVSDHEYIEEKENK